MIGSDEFKQLCPAGKGFDGDGKVINDCDVLPNACQVCTGSNQPKPEIILQNGECKNNMPGFTCICNVGFEIDETGTKCIGEYYDLK